MKPIRALLIASAALIATPAMAAECETVDVEFERKAASNPASKEAFHNRLLKDFRQLRNAAAKLKVLGYEDSCASVMKSIHDMRDSPKAVRMHMVANSKPEEVDLTFYERQQLAMKRAKPLSEIGGVHSADIIGAEVYGASGKSVGEVDDIIVSADDKKAFAIVGFGGFLGFSQEQIAVPLSKIKIEGNGDAIFIPISEQAMNSAPRFKTGSRDWITNSGWLEKNFAFYGD